MAAAIHKPVGRSAGSHSANITPTKTATDRMDASVRAIASYPDVRDA
jgi:hypothetical protein